MIFFRFASNVLNRVTSAKGRERDDKTVIYISDREWNHGQFFPVAHTMGENCIKKMSQYKRNLVMTE